MCRRGLGIVRIHFRGQWSKLELKKRKALYSQAVTKLEPRELEILTARRLEEEPKTLEDLSQKYSISRERVRQIENKAIRKLQDEIKIISDQKLLPKS